MSTPAEPSRGIEATRPPASARGPGSASARGRRGRAFCGAGRLPDGVAGPACHVIAIADLATSAGGKMVRNQQHKLLCAALRTLPVEQQTLLELHYWDGLDAQALAEVFESNAAAIRNRLHRAREKLREAMLATEGVAADTVATVEAVDALARSLG